MPRALNLRVPVSPTLTHQNHYDVDSEF